MFHNQPPVQLSHYGSVTSDSFLWSLGDSVLAGDTDLTPFLSTGDSSAESTHSTAPDYAYVVACVEGGGGSALPPPPLTQSLVRQQAYPAEFLSDHIVLDTVGSRVGYGHQFLGMGGPMCPLSSRQGSLSSIPELSSTDELGDLPNINPYDVLYNTNSDIYMPSWDSTHSFGFAASTSKCAEISHDDVIATKDGIDCQLNLPGTPIDVTAMEKLLQMQQDAVPCRVRAKRGCATHPRSIAERLRRAKISEKLKRLQELVAPNMDKQTNTADMLDLAVQHIRVLKSQIQTLQQECGGCTCMRNQDIHSSE